MSKEPSSERPESSSGGDDTAFSATAPSEQPTAGDRPATQQEVERLLAQAQAGLDDVDSLDAETATAPQPYQLNNLESIDQPADPHPMDLLGDVELDLRIELGRTQMCLDEVLRLRSGSVVALDKLAGDPVDVYVNGRLIARGEVLVLNDSFCVRVTELVGAGL